MLCNLIWVEKDSGQLLPAKAGSLRPQAAFKAGIPEPM